MNAIELAYSKVPELLVQYGLPDISKRHIKECPICKGKNKFRVDNYRGEGNWICSTCGSGNIFKLIELVHGVSFREICQQIEKDYGLDKPSYKPVDRSAFENAMHRVRNAKQFKNSNVHEYLKARQIYETPRKGLFASEGNMFAIAVDSQAKPVYTHETYLDGNKKAKVQVQKKLLKICNHEPDMAMIRLTELSSTLGIAEGIETALSCRQLYKCNTWSVVNASFMKKFRAPEGVNHLIIYADNDKNGTGLAAAFECASANIKSRNSVTRATVKWCSIYGYDFNDFITKGFSEVHEWRIGE